MNYLRSYVDRFGLRQCIKFEHRVVSIEYVGLTEEKMAVWEYWAENGEAFGGGQGKWHITVLEHEKKIEVCIRPFLPFVFSFSSLEISMITLISAN